MDVELADTAVAAIRDIDGPIVLTGAGRCFSAGDLFLTSATAAFFAVFDQPAPVVAAINEHAIAGGCVLAMASDVRFMSVGIIGLSELVVGVRRPTTCFRERSRQPARWVNTPPVAFAAMKEQLHGPAHDLIDGSADMDAPK
jgi:hypothetical protein